MPKNKSCCIGCKWARWQWTEHSPPRINHKKAGRCRYPVANLALIVPTAFAVEIKGPFGIWTDWPTACRYRVEEEKETK